MVFDGFPTQKSFGWTICSATALDCLSEAEKFHNPGLILKQTNTIRYIFVFVCGQNRKFRE